MVAVEPIRDNLRPRLTTEAMQVCRRCIRDLSWPARRRAAIATRARGCATVPLTNVGWRERCRRKATDSSAPELSVALDLATVGGTQERAYRRRRRGRSASSHQSMASESAAQCSSVRATRMTCEPEPVDQQNLQSARVAFE